MKTQTAQFLDGAADDYYERNRADMGKHRDPVSDLFFGTPYVPKRVLEIGCGNGWRLKKWREHYGCGICGIEPSGKAVAEGNAALGGVFLKVGTADRLPYNEPFDVIIMGYCLWLIHPNEYFRVVGETDRLLVMDGHLLVHDFLTGRPMQLKDGGPPEASAREKEAMKFLTMHEFSKLWLGHPYYRQEGETVNACQLRGGMTVMEGVNLLIKGDRHILRNFN